MGEGTCNSKSYHYRLFSQPHKTLICILKLPLRPSALTSASLCVKNGLNRNGTYSRRCGFYSTKAQLPNSIIRHTYPETRQLSATEKVSLRKVERVKFPTVDASASPLPWV